MNGRAFRRGPTSVFPHNKSHTADDSTGLRLSEKIDLALDTFADFVVPVGLQEHARYTADAPIGLTGNCNLDTIDVGQAYSPIDNYG